MAAPGVAALQCPKCGAAITIRAVQQTQTVVCASCHAVLDACDQQLHVVQEYQARMDFEPQLPLGRRGMLHAREYEVTGFQVRSVRTEEQDAFWREYTLWNPYQGYRYLTEYDGHWCDFVVTRMAPSEMVSGRQPYVTHGGTLFRHFRTATATTQFILGEFPWQVRSGDRVTVRDFVAPPMMVSEEVSPSATIWSVGTYLAPEVVWRAFALPGQPPRPQGIFECEPNPHSDTWKARYRRGRNLGIAALAALLAFPLLAHRVNVAWYLGPVLLALAIAALPACLAWRAADAMETARWADSDYAEPAE